MKKIGDMRQRLALQQEVRTADTGGGASLSWSTIKTIWAEVMPVSAREDMQGEKLSGRTTHKIITRYDSGITTDMRLLLGARIFNIRGVRNVEERGRFLEIIAEEGVAQ